MLTTASSLIQATCLPLCALFRPRRQFLSPEMLLFGQIGELAGELAAVRLVRASDLPNPGFDVLADLCPPCADLIGGRGYRRWLNFEKLLGIPLEERIYRATGTAGRRRRSSRAGRRE